MRICGSISMVAVMAVSTFMVIGTPANAGGKFKHVGKAVQGTGKVIEKPLQGGTGKAIKKRVQNVSRKSIETGTPGIVRSEDYKPPKIGF